jgi:hypothetical protein
LRGVSSADIAAVGWAGLADVAPLRGRPGRTRRPRRARQRADGRRCRRGPRWEVLITRPRSDRSQAHRARSGHLFVADSTLCVCCMIAQVPQASSSCSHYATFCQPRHFRHLLQPHPESASPAASGSIFFSPLLLPHVLTTSQQRRTAAARSSALAVASRLGAVLPSVGCRSSCSLFSAQCGIAARCQWCGEVTHTVCACVCCCAGTSSR